MDQVDVNREKEEEIKKQTGPGPAPGRSLSLKILSRAGKVLFLWVPAAVAALVALVLLALPLYLTPSRVEKMIITNFNSMSHGDISLKVKDFSPYGGFEMSGILIRNGEEFGRTKFVEIERLVVRYRLFSMLIGNVLIPEIGIYKPRIYLEERKGAWNAARLMKPGEVKPEEKKEPPPGGTPSKEINLPVSVELLFRFVLDDLRVYVKGGTFTSSVQGLSLTMDVWAPPFKRIPKSLEAVTLLDRMKIELNPKEEMDISFYSRDAEVSPPLILTWKLLYNREEKGKPRFESLLKFGTYRTPVRFKRSHLAPLSFMVSYDIFYNPLNDFLKINHFGVRFLGKKWIWLAGQVKSVTKNQDLYLRMTESTIDLADLYPYYVSLTGDRKMRFSGTVSLCPLTVQGTLNAMDIDGELNLKNILFKNPAAEATIPSLRLTCSVLKRGENMKILSRMAMPHLFYAMERNRSGDNGAEMAADISAFDNFRRVDINKFVFRLYCPATAGNALDLALGGDITLKPEMNGHVRITKFTFLKEPLDGMLPPNLRKSLKSVPLKKPVDMNLDLKFALGPEAVRAVLGMVVKVPDFDMNDLRLGLDVVQNSRKRTIDLRDLRLGSVSRNLSVSVKGSVEMRQPPFSDADIRVDLKLDLPEMKTVYEGYKCRGLVELHAAMKGNMKNGRASGSMKIDKFFLKNEAQKLSVEDLNMDFPFEYYLTPRYRGESKIAVDKTQVIDNAFFKEKENFRIKSIRAKHPARDISFEYLKDFGATMFFRDNTFEIAKLRAYVLDGSLYGRDILFNLADMKPRNMEYKLLLDVTNVDIGKLDEPDPAKKIRDAELSLNANLIGRSIDFKRSINAKGSINIFKVGKDFANRLMKGLSEKKGKSKLGLAQFAVDNSESIEGFTFNLDQGLVYTTVAFKRNLIGYAFGVENDKVQFDRIPIQEYVRNIMGGK